MITPRRQARQGRPGRGAPVICAVKNETLAGLAPWREKCVSDLAARLLRGSQPSALIPTLRVEMPPRTLCVPSSDRPISEATGRRASRTAFPRGAWERGTSSSRAIGAGAPGVQGFSLGWVTPRLKPWTPGVPYAVPSGSHAPAWEPVRALPVPSADRTRSAVPAFHAGAWERGITPRRQAAEEFSHKGTKTQRRKGMITPRRQARQGRPGVMCTCHLHSEELDLGELGALA